MPFTSVPELVVSRSLHFGDEISEKEADLTAREDKILGLEKDLEKKRGIKKALALYARTGREAVLRILSPGAVTDGHVFFAGNDCGTLAEYERKTEACIRRKKTQLKLLREAKKQAEIRLGKRKTEGVERAIFSGKAFYKTKDTTQVDINTWKKEYGHRRHRSMSLPGRHDSKKGNVPFPL